VAEVLTMCCFFGAAWMHPYCIGMIRVGSYSFFRFVGGGGGLSPRLKSDKRALSGFIQSLAQVFFITLLKIYFSLRNKLLSKKNRGMGLALRDKTDSDY
jgi:hypothetical protein